MLPYSRQTIYPEDIDAVVRVLKSDWLTQGPAVHDFETALCQLTGARHAVAVANGTAALYLACRALDLSPADKGITSPMSFAASASCMVLAGAGVDFVDIEADTLCMDPGALRAYCEQKQPPAVVIPIDFAGISARLPEIWKLSRKFGFKVIEDAAHAIGSSYCYDGERFNCGQCAHSDLATFSFHPVKNITCAEGGAVTTNDPELAERVRHLANHGVEKDASRFQTRIPGRIWPYEVQDISFNFRLSDLHAALGKSQLSRLEKFKAKRAGLARIYSERLSALEQAGLLRLPVLPESCDPCLHLFVIRTGPETKITRQELFERLMEEGIRCQVHYWPIHLHPLFRKKYGFKEDDFPVAEEAASHCLSIPLFPQMSKEDAIFVADTLTEILKE